MKARSMFGVSAALLALGLGFGGAAGCSSGGDSGSNSGASTSGGAGGSSGSGGTTAGWGEGACYGCVSGVCGSAIGTCQSDPTCAARLECLQACSSGADGNVDASCAAACPTASGSAGEEAIEALDTCLTTAAASCADCGGNAGAGGTGGSGTGGTGGATCEPDILCQDCGGPSDETNTCWKCQEEKCCDTDAACADDEKCTEYFRCYQDCLSLKGTQECLDECDATVGAEHYEGVSRKLGCVLTLCDEECGTTDACAVCINDNCGAELARCERIASCSRASVCVGDCGGVQTCVEGCFAEYPGSENLLSEILACTQARCEDLCS